MEQMAEMIQNLMSEKDISKYISLILRHEPEVIGITLDEHGWEM